MMKSIAVVSLGMITAALLGGNASASSTQWFEAQGGRVRLVTTGTPDAQGRLEGILDIHLDPGWKTYWRDPGDAGVPPQLDVSTSTNITGAEVSFPAPQRHDDGYSTWAGYDHSVALPVVFHVGEPNKPAMIEADIFLGICETICIPVHTKLSLDPASAPDDDADAASVAAAFAALPMAARPDFGVKLVKEDDKSVVVEATSPADTSKAEFFLAGGEGYSFAAPRREEKEGKTLFSIDVLDHPATKPADGGMHYTLVTDGGAVSGILPYP
jgi:DsbC/DsbD-like thiol-disulfide interchange protein